MQAGIKKTIKPKALIPLKNSLLVFYNRVGGTDFENSISRHCCKRLLCVCLCCELCTNWAYALLFLFIFLKLVVKNSPSASFQLLRSIGEQKLQ
jgi:hypothetical protein